MVGGKRHLPSACSVVVAGHDASGAEGSPTDPSIVQPAHQGKEVDVGLTAPMNLTESRNSASAVDSGNEALTAAQSIAVSRIASGA